jgi:hypothetical protein
MCVCFLGGYVQHFRFLTRARTMNSASMHFEGGVHTKIMSAWMEIFGRLIVLEGFVTWNKFWCYPSSSPRARRITAAAAAFFFFGSLSLSALYCGHVLAVAWRERVDKEVLVLISGCNAGKLWPDNWFDVNHELENQPVGFSPFLSTKSITRSFLSVGRSSPSVACVCGFFLFSNPNQRNCLVRERCAPAKVPRD